MSIWTCASTLEDEIWINFVSLRGPGVAIRHTLCAMGQKPSPANKAIAAELRAVRARADMTQRQVYELAGISRSTYLRYENNERDITVDSLAAICKALGISVGDLIRNAEIQSPESFGIKRVVTGGVRQGPLAEAPEPPRTEGHEATEH